MSRFDHYFNGKFMHEIRSGQRKLFRLYNACGEGAKSFGPLLVTFIWLVVIRTFEFFFSKINRLIFRIKLIIFCMGIDVKKKKNYGKLYCYHFISSIEYINKITKSRRKKTLAHFIYDIKAIPLCVPLKSIM